jgi:hypothetical protein
MNVRQNGELTERVRAAIAAMLGQPPLPEHETEKISV